MPCIARSGIQKNRIIPENPGSQLAPRSTGLGRDDELRYSLSRGRVSLFFPYVQDLFFTKLLALPSKIPPHQESFLMIHHIRLEPSGQAAGASPLVEIEEKKWYMFEAKRSSE
jgi:hypothetical protein